ncbi:unnamed protein product [Prorocentrum cordatum]|uniref:Uncharacterized protein n=1 Tax=Prorocentrum cordatum TaxID=2364126 RepID=A0ABN9PTN2_9DINO|nr:unnamed protein product [Polarella glacialis]
MPIFLSRPAAAPDEKPRDLKRCVDAIATPLEAEELMQDMSAATEMLEKQQRIVVLP